MIYRISAILSLLSGHRWAAALLLVVWGVFLPLYGALVCGYAVPAVHDEFANLFAAQNYASLRWAAPGLPTELVPFFQSFYLLLEPVSTSKYPPGQGMQLALGMWLGHPLHGVWLTIGLCAAAVWWMLRACTEHPWPFLGGLAFPIFQGGFSYFGHSYWGGSLMILAGVLVTGGILNFLLRQRHFEGALAMGAGAGLMLLTRPFEGLVFGLPPIAVIGWHLITVNEAARRALLRAMVPGALVLLAFGSIMLWSNHAVTGSAAKLPYNVYNERFFPGVPFFGWDEIGDPVDTGIAELNTAQEIGGFLHPPSWVAGMRRIALGTSSNFERLFPGLFLFGAVLSFVIPMEGRRICFLLAAWVLFIPVLTWVSLNLAHFGFFHYVSVWVGPATALAFIGLFKVGRLLREAGITRAENGWVVFVLFALLAIGCYRFALNITAEFPFGKPNHMEVFVERREQVRLHLESLASETGQQQVAFVSYGPQHLIHHEWVYNQPDPFTAKVVFVRSRGDELDRELVPFFAEAKFWELTVNNVFAPVGLAEKALD